MIKLGNLNISSIYYGGNEISSVYYGSTLIYKKEQDEFIDLGLPSGTLWCNHYLKNVSVFWGQSGISEKCNGWSDYKFGQKDSITKYNSSDNKLTLDPEDDIVSTLFGREYSIPTKEQFEELQQYTTQERCVINGKDGLKFTSITYPTKYIFFEETMGGGIVIWSSSVDDYYWYKSYAMDCNLDYFNSFISMSYDRIENFPIRPVKNPSISDSYVDLNLPSGTLWAKCNIGANSPTEHGKYFAWGETVGYYDNEEHDFGWNTYKYGSDLTKYNATDGKTTLDLEDDAVHVNMGGDWHIPTQAQIEELLNETNNRWVANYQGSGVHGMLFTSKTDSTKIIFIPNSGFRSGTSVSNRGDYADLWSSSLVTDHPDFSCNLFFDSEDYFAGQGYRCYGYCLRGVIG